MKIIVTGSLGNISKPLTKELIEKGHQVTVISSKPEKKKDIEALGAKAAIGSVYDVAFLTETFTGADAVYCMIPPNHFGEPDVIAYFRKVGDAYGQAIRQSGVKRVVDLSSYGADQEEGTGLIQGAHHAEKIFDEIPGITLTHIRPVYFYYNLLGAVNRIKKEGIIAANYGADKVLMVSPIDIADAVAEELVTPSGNKVRYVSSDALTGDEIAHILGEALGKPDLKWVLISDEQTQQNYQAVGLAPHLARELTEMFAALRTGKLEADYQQNKPKTPGKIKFATFAKDFAAAYNQL